jgi:hypothetical protein
MWFCKASTKKGSNVDSFTSMAATGCCVVFSLRFSPKKLLFFFSQKTRGVLFWVLLKAELRGGNG